MSNNLRQDRLGLVSKGIVGCLISMCRKLEGLLQLPLEVQLQAHWNLVTGETAGTRVSVMIKEQGKQFAYISFVGISN